jgi:multidrug efflux pump subunit AcrA (membrane-fusion protein)
MNTVNLVTQGSNALVEVLPPITPEQEAAAALHEAMSVVTQAKMVVVTDDATYRAADDACAAIKAAMKKAENERDGWVRPLNTQVKRINASFKDIENAYNAALSAYRTPMTAYQTQLAEARRKAEAEAQKERERLEAIAREEQRKAKAEYDRIAAEAEAARIAAEQAAQKARQDAESAADANTELDPFDALLAEGNATEHAEESARETQRLADEAQAKVDAAAESYKQSIRDSRVEVAAAYVPKVTGSGSKTYELWEYTITDHAKVPMEYRPIDLAMVAAEVKRSKGATSIPGVTVTSRMEVK